MKNIKIEKDPELEDLIAKCKKKGLKFGLALGSGSARGMAHIGVIQILEAYHIPIDMIAGTSIGSVVGSVYATGASVKHMKEAALSMKRSKTISLMDPTLPHSGLISGNWSEPLRLDTLSLNTPCIPENYSLPIASRIPLEADSLKMNAASSYYTHLQ